MPNWRWKMAPRCSFLQCRKYPACNWSRLSSHIVRRFGMTGLREGHITVRLRGSAGQSLGAFATQGLSLEVIGDANDYVGKGLSGGVIVVRPSAAAGFNASDNTIVATRFYTGPHRANCLPPVGLGNACVCVIPVPPPWSRGRIKCV